MAKDMKWISVEDRLPNDNQLVLIYEPHCRNNKEKGIGIDDYELGDQDYGKWISHWMSLPDPPE